MAVIYTIGWIIIIIIGFIWLYIAENKNPTKDYQLAGLFITGIAITWPISVPIVIIIYLFKKLKR